MMLRQKKETSKNKSDNMFDNHPALLAPVNADVGDEITRYLTLSTEDVHDGGLLWWIERRKLYPRLSRMALDYLTIPREFFSDL